MRHRLGIEGVAPAVDGGRSRFRRMADDSRGAVDREIDTRGHRASRDHGHDTDKRFQHHGTIADKARLPFPENHFRGGARGNQRMKSADGAASNGESLPERFSRSASSPLLAAPSADFIR